MTTTYPEIRELPRPARPKWVTVEIHPDRVLREYNWAEDLERKKKQGNWKQAYYKGVANRLAMVRQGRLGEVAAGWYLNLPTNDEIMFGAEDRADLVCPCGYGIEVKTRKGPHSDMMMDQYRKVQGDVIVVCRATPPEIPKYPVQVDLIGCIDVDRWLEIRVEREFGYGPTWFVNERELDDVRPLKEHVERCRQALEGGPPAGEHQS